MISLDKLRAFGADVDAGLARCMNSEALYLRLVGMAANEPSFAALGKYLKEGDLGRAFEEAHKLKGVAGTLSLSPIYTPVSALTELLRSRTDGDYEKLYAEIAAKAAELAALTK